MRIILFLLAFILLTLTTQIGGGVLLLAWVFCRLFIVHMRFPATIIVFALLYCAMTFAVIPALAPLFGRVALPCQSLENHYKAASPAYCWLNRNYTTTETKEALTALSLYMNKTYPDTQTLYLDASFPFSDAMPLWPHLTHKDGKKIDLAYYYRDATGNYVPGLLRSPIGYWGYEQPSQDDELPCANEKGFSLRWNFNWLQPLFTNQQLDEERTRAALQWLATNGVNYGVTQIVLEPYLKKRLGLNNDVIRFQGCRAARHDDHMHIDVQ